MSTFASADCQPTTSHQAAVKLHMPRSHTCMLRGRSSKPKQMLRRDCSGGSLNQ